MINLLYVFFSFFNLYAEVEMADLAHHASMNAARVPEFIFIRKTAEKMGVKVYLFGGSAAAYAHYVRWDLERLSGDKKHQPERFDYDFTNIYRGNQDLDIVVDGTESQAQVIRNTLQNTYPHFVGTKESWEVRLLRESMGDKFPLLDDPEFSNQHTDTNSTGMLDLTAAQGEPVFRDLLDWNNPDSQFLKDVAAAKITYLFNEKHEETIRFKEGKNPPIFSAVRYLAKLTQYEVEGTQADLKVIQEIIKSTDFKHLSDYVKYKLSEFAIKTLLNSPSSEYAWNLMEELGLREKLIAMDGGQTAHMSSLSWWLNKEPLRSKEFGTEGRTVLEVFGKDEVIVSHETNSFQAYENITRSSRGEANAFISRNNVEGEAAVYGDGFYVRTGLKGARGTGLTIRFKLHPQARENTDFTVHGDYLVIKNKKALILIQENINIRLKDFLRLMLSNNLQSSDKGLLEKFKRKYKRIPSDSEEMKEAYEYVKNLFFISEDFPREYSYHLNLDGVSFKSLSQSLSDDLNNYLRKMIAPLLRKHDLWRGRPDRVMALIEKEILNDEIVERLLSNEYWQNHPEVITKLVKAGGSDRKVIKHIFVHPFWAENHPELLEYMLEKGNVNDWIATRVLPLPHWEAYISYYKKIIEQGVYLKSVADGFATHRIGLRNLDLVKLFIQKKQSEPTEYLIENVLSDPEWSNHPEIIEFIMEETTTGHFHDLMIHIFSHPAWAKHPKLMEKFLKLEVDKPQYFTNALKHEHWSPYPEFLVDLIERNNRNIDDAIIKEVLTQPHWQKHVQLFDLYLKREKIPPGVIELILTTPFGETFPDYLFEIFKSKQMSQDVMKRFFKDKKIENHVDVILSYLDNPNLTIEGIRFVIDKIESAQSYKIVEKIISGKHKDVIPDLTLQLMKEDWVKHPDLISKLIDLNSQHRSIAMNILSKEHWFNEKLVRALIKSKEANDAVTGLILSHDYWVQFPEIVRELIEVYNEDRHVAFSVLSNKVWIEHPELVELIIERGQADSILIEKVFTNSEWAQRPEVLEKLINTKRVNKRIIKELLTLPHWSQHPRLVLKILEMEKFDTSTVLSGLWNTIRSDDVSKLVISKLLNQTAWQEFPEIVVTLIHNGTVGNELADLFVKNKAWSHHPVFRAFLGSQEVKYSSLVKKMGQVYFRSWYKDFKGSVSVQALSCAGIL